MGTPAWMQRKVRHALERGEVLLVTHGRCVDGLTAAALARRAWPRSVSLHVQHEDLPDTLGAVAAALEESPGAHLNVLVADLAPQREHHDLVLARLDRLTDRARVVWLDHHAPQWSPEDEARLRDRLHHLHVDRTGTQSGASLTLGFLRGLDGTTFPPPAQGLDDHELLHYVDRVRGRDTWTDSTEEGLRLMLVARQLHDEDYIRLFAEGQFRALLLLSDEPYRRHRRAVEKAVESVRVATPHVSLLWGRHPVSDAAAAHFAADPESQVLVQVGPGGGLSIRSRAPVAAEIAQAFGGGGHENAAGARLVEGPVRTWWLRKRGRRHRRVRRVVRMAERLVRGREVQGRPARTLQGDRRERRTVEWK